MAWHLNDPFESAFAAPPASLTFSFCLSSCCKNENLFVQSTRISMPGGQNIRPPAVFECAFMQVQSLPKPRLELVLAPLKSCVLSCLVFGAVSSNSPVFFFFLRCGTRCTETCRQLCEYVDGEHKGRLYKSEQDVSIRVGLYAESLDKTSTKVWHDLGPHLL